MINKRNTIPWTYFNDVINEEIVRKFYEKELQKTSQPELKIEIVIKRKGDRL